MRCFLDTNMLVSVALWPSGVAARAFDKAVTKPNVGVVCSQTVEEVREVFTR